jgi:putative transposase
MRQIGKQFLETPFYGVRQMTWHLRNEGHLVNEKRIPRLMRLMSVCQENRPLDAFADPPHSRSTKGPIPAGQPKGTRFILICSEVCALSGQTK